MAEKQEYPEYMAKKPRIYATMGPFVFAYPHITSPDTEGTYADSKYKVDAVGDPNGKGMKAAQTFVKKALKEFALPEDANHPIKRETTKDDNGNKAETGKLVLKAKSKFAPAVVDARGNPLPAKALKNLKVGPGTEGYIEGYFAPYTSTVRVKDKATGKIETVETHGVNFTLTGVQIVKLVKGGGGGSSFGAVEGGGFTYGDDDFDEDDEDTRDSSGDLDLDEDDDDDGDLDI